jgi:hypothetical protein
MAADGGSPNTPEVKGNVIVSVRVRPDAGGDGPGSNKTDGEWMVDGRRSLVAYKGREGGDYYYGKKRIHPISTPRVLIILQIMYLRHTTTTHEYTMAPQRDWYDESWKAIMERYLHTV